MIVLDTTVLIDVFRGHRPALGYLQALEQIPVCSELTRIEVLCGIRHGERDKAEALLGALRWIGVDEQVARRAGALGRTWRRSHALSTVDLVIAATAKELGADLATSNAEHYPMFDALAAPY